MRKRTNLSLGAGGRKLWIVGLGALLLIGMSMASASASAQSVSQYRAFWVDTFNTTLNNHADVVAVIERGVEGVYPERDRRAHV